MTYRHASRPIPNGGVGSFNPITPIGSKIKAVCETLATDDLKTAKLASTTFQQNLGEASPTASIQVDMGSPFDGNPFAPLPGRTGRPAQRTRLSGSAVTVPGHTGIGLPDCPSSAGRPARYRSRSPGGSVYQLVRTAASCISQKKAAEAQSKGSSGGGRIRQRLRQ